MQEVWLRPNRRVLVMAMVLPSIVSAIAIYFVLTADAWSALRIVWLVVAAGGLLLLGLLVWQCRKPRIAEQDGHLLLYLKSGPPYRLPLEVVECFFLGATGAALPSGPGSEASEGRITALVLRLAERERQWHERPVKPALGQWDEGYVRIHGAWCERLCSGVVSRLNTKLRESQRAAKQAAEGMADSGN